MRHCNHVCWRNSVGEKECFCSDYEKENILYDCWYVILRKKFYNLESREEAIAWVYALRASVYFANLKKVVNDPRNFLKAEHKSDKQKSGMLVKKGGTVQTRKKRFFVLKNAELLYYKTPKASEPIDTIDLKGARIEKHTDPKKKECAIKVLTPQRQ